MPSPVASTSSAKKSGDSITGFLGNLASSTGQGLLGIGEGLGYYLPKAVYDAATGNAAPIEAMGSGIADQYKQFYSPLVEGNFGKFAQNVYDNPFQPVMDVASLVTGGAGLAGKGAELAAMGGEAGSAAADVGARVAGLTRIPAADIASSPAIAAAKDLGIVPKLARNGDALIPKLRSVVDPHTGVSLHDIPKGVARNPVIRGRQALMEATYAKISPDNPILGRMSPTERGPRLETAMRNRRAAIAHLPAIRAVQVADKALTPDERLAVGARTGIGVKDAASVKTWRTMVQSKVDAINAARDSDGGIAKGSAKELANQTVKLKEIDAASPLIAHPTPAMLDAEGAIYKLHDSVQEARASNTAAVPFDPLHDQMTIDSSAAQPLRIIHGAKPSLLHPTEVEPTAAAVRAQRDLEAVTDNVARKNIPAKHIRELTEAAKETQPVAKPGLYGGELTEIPEGTKLAKYSFSTNRSLNSDVRGASAAMARKADNDKLSTGHAFASGDYEFPTPAGFVKQAVGEYMRAGSDQTMQAALKSGIQFDPLNPDHDALVHGPKARYKVVTKDSPLRQKLGQLSNFIHSKLLPIAEEHHDEATVQMADTLAQWEAEIAGHGVMLPKSVLPEFQRQVSDSASLLYKALRRPTQVWKSLTLGLKGSFYANTFFGHLLLGMVGYGPQFVKEAFASGSTRFGAGKQLEDAAPGLMAYGDPLRSEAHMAQDVNEGIVPKILNAPERALNAVGGKAAETGSKFTTMNFRRAATVIELKRAAKLLAKFDGSTPAEALTKLMHDPVGLDTAREAMARKMLDYSKLTPFERNQVRAFVPFWNYTRAIVSRTGSLALDEPVKLNALSQLSNYSLKKSDGSIFGGLPLSEVPEYDLGLMPTGATKNGKTPELSTYGFNLFSTPADLVSQLGGSAAGQAGDSNPLAQVNPFIGAALDAATGKDMFTGEPVQGSAAQVFEKELLNSVPQYQWYDAATHPNPDSLIQRTPDQKLAQYFGAPVGTFSVPNLEQQNAINAYYAAAQNKTWAKAAAKRMKDYIGASAGIAV